MTDNTLILYTTSDGQASVVLRELGGQLGTTKACEARTIEDLHRKVWKEEILLELHDDAHDLETCGDEMELRAL